MRGRHDRARTRSPDSFYRQRRRDRIRLATAPGRPFHTVLADPPWQFVNKTGKVAPEHRRLSRYRTMTLDEILRFPSPASWPRRRIFFYGAPTPCCLTGCK